MIEKQGGRVVSIEEIDGPDVIGINARWAAPLNFSGSSLRYWQPRIVSEDEMLRVLRECQEKPSRVDGKRKVDASMEHPPLTENPNSAGSNKRRKTHEDDKVEIIDLVDDLSYWLMASRPQLCWVQYATHDARHTTRKSR
jgi:hypothetical protein